MASKKTSAIPPTPSTLVQLIRAADVKPEKLEYLWRGKFPKGTVSLIGGRPDQGKSLVSNFLAAEITRAGGAVIMSNPEDQLAPVKVPRALAAKADTRLLHFWPGKVRLPDDVEQLEELVTFHGIELVTIDPIAKHIRGKDPNTALEPLMRMAERTGVAVVGIHHLIKRLPKDAHPQEAFGGASGGWLGSVREAYVFGPAAGGEPESRYLAVAKANNQRGDSPAVEFYIEEVEVELPNGEVDETGRAVFVTDQAKVNAAAVVHYKGEGYNAEPSPEKKQVAEEFLTLLLMKGPAPFQTICDKAAEVGVSKATMRRAGEALEVVKRRHGWGPGSHMTWELPPTHPLGSLGAVVQAESESGQTVDEAIAEILGGGDA